ncbi:serine protease snake-like [Helicoverpa zea]|uniref:serine protease snake-like n=1 Tax=Helicoverpa zea TaxID=7113 RepID=UPI001F5AF5F7|nr:serine protease snake-like [Helicoverpa zea]
MDYYVYVILNVIFISASVFCEDLYEGSECTSDNGLKGTCVDIFKCMQYVEDLQKRRYPQICSYEVEKPIVCCSDCKLVNDTRNVLVDATGLHYYKTGVKAYDKCLEYILDEASCDLWGGVRKYLDEDQGCYGYTDVAVLAVAKGMDVERGEYPHMALLGFGDAVETAEWLCGGSLISHRFVLTAAHCMSSRSAGPVSYIALGILKRSDPPETWQIYGVKRIIPHPGYKAPSKYHDIALLLTDRWVQFSRYVLPACLHTEEIDASEATATGWGALGNRQGLSDTLQSVVLSAYSEEECSSFYPPHRHLVNGYNHTTQMCYGDKDDTRDTCEGDSGGPLQIRSSISSCASTIIGITSNGKPCGQPGSSGVYTRVSYYVPWIESIVW